MGVDSSHPAAAIRAAEKLRAAKEILEEMLPYIERAALEHGQMSHIVFLPDTRDLVRRIREVI